MVRSRISEPGTMLYEKHSRPNSFEDLIDHDQNISLKFLWHSLAHESDRQSNLYAVNLVRSYEGSEREEIPQIFSGAERLRASTLTNTHMKAFNIDFSTPYRPTDHEYTETTYERVNLEIKKIERNMADILIHMLPCEAKGGGGGKYSFCLMMGRNGLCNLVDQNKTSHLRKHMCSTLLVQKNFFF